MTIGDKPRTFWEAAKQLTAGENTVEVARYLHETTLIPTGAPEWVLENPLDESQGALFWAMYAALPELLAAYDQLEAMKQAKH